MSPRFIVRREQDASRYSVWDNEKNRLATYEGRECTNLDFHDAFKVADDLNAENMQAKEK
jgi:hypothetical protein